jgi:hypothetical protein
MLEGQESDLKKHVGHRVEITGTTTVSMGANGTRSGGSATTSGAGATGSGSASTGSTAQGDAMSSSVSGGHLRVNAIKMISSDCSGSGR